MVDLVGSIGQIVEAAHHASELAELVLCQAGLKQRPLGPAVLHHLGDVLQINPLAPLQVIDVPRVALVQLVEELVDSVRRGIRKQLLVHL